MARWIINRHEEHSMDETNWKPQRRVAIIQ